MEAGPQGSRAPRAVLRVAPKAGDLSPSRPKSCDPAGGHASARLANGGSPAPTPRPKDDIVLPAADYQLGSPRARAEASNSLARVMEIQRQAAMMPHYPSVQWLDSFMHTRALEETSRYQQVPPQGAPFENLYNQLAETAVKNTERCQPLKCPNFPKLPKKRTRRKSSRSGKGDQMSNMDDNCSPPPNPAPTNNQEELVRLKLPSESGGNCHQTYQGSPLHNSQSLFGPVPAAAQTLPTVSATPTSFMVYTGVVSQPPCNQISYSSGQMQVQQGSFMGFQGAVQQGAVQPGSYQPAILQQGPFQAGSLQQQPPGYPTVFQTEGCFFPSQPQVFWTQSNGDGSAGGRLSRDPSSSKQLLVQQQQASRGRTPSPNFQSKGEQRIQSIFILAIDITMLLTTLKMVPGSYFSHGHWQAGCNWTFLPMLEVAAAEPVQQHHHLKNCNIGNTATCQHLFRFNCNRNG